ncbi:11324_t:CDS:2, partial [Acaulospora colombiana]
MPLRSWDAIGFEDGGVASKYISSPSSDRGRLPAFTQNTGSKEAYLVDVGVLSSSSDPPRKWESFEIFSVSLDIYSAKKADEGRRVKFAEERPSFYPDHRIFVLKLNVKGSLMAQVKKIYTQMENKGIPYMTLASNPGDSVMCGTTNNPEVGMFCIADTHSAQVLGNPLSCPPMKLIQLWAALDLIYGRSLVVFADRHLL